jgi:hypothetical protein
MVICEIDNENYKKLKNLFKKIKTNKFKKELKSTNEIKSTKISDDIKYHILNRSNKFNFKIYCIVVEKNNEIKKLIEKNNINDLYIDIVCELIKKCNINSQTYLKFDRFTPNNYLDNFRDKILKFNKGNSLKLHFADSQQFKGIQFVDVISWVLFQSFENKNSKYLEKGHFKPEIFYY